MTARRDAMFDAAVSELLDAMARGGRAEDVVNAALATTTRVRQRPAWLTFPWDVGSIGRRVPSQARVLVVAALVLAATVLFLVAVGSQRRPPPFGLARSGSIAYESGGHIWLAGADGGSPRQVTFGSTTELAPVWSRDGTMFAYRRLTENEPAGDPMRFADLVVVSADGMNPVTVAANVPAMSNPTWSPDSRRIAFTRSFGTGPDHLVIVAADGSSETDLGDLGGGAWGPAWAPDGVRIAVAVRNQLVVVNIDGSGREVVSHGTYEEVGSQGIVGDWSPDGSAFVFAVGPPDQKRVYLTFLDGRDETMIGPDQPALDPSWSPDGSMIAYLRSGTGVGPAVEIVDRSGKYVRTLPGFFSWCTPVWSPDGQRIIVLDDRRNGNGPAETVVLAVDVAGIEPPIELAAPAGAVVNDNIAGGWQRLAP